VAGDLTRNAIDGEGLHHIIRVVLHRSPAGEVGQLLSPHGAVQAQAHHHLHVRQARLQGREGQLQLQAAGEVRDGDRDRRIAAPGAQGPAWVMCLHDSHRSAARKGRYCTKRGQSSSDQALVEAS
jgi:hypothetical protein